MTSLFDIINPEIYFHRLRILFSLLFISIFFSVVSGQIYISDNVKFSISDSTVFYISGELVTTDESIEVVENKIVKVPHRKEFETSIKSEINNEPNNLGNTEGCTYTWGTSIYQFTHMSGWWNDAPCDVTTFSQYGANQNIRAMNQLIIEFEN